MKTFNLVTNPADPKWLTASRLLTAEEGQKDLTVSLVDAVDSNGQPREVTLELDGKQWAALAEFAAAQSLLLTDEEHHLDAHDSTEWVNR